MNVDPRPQNFLVKIVLSKLSLSWISEEKTFMPVEKVMSVYQFSTLVCLAGQDIWTDVFVCVCTQYSLVSLTFGTKFKQVYYTKWKESKTSQPTDLTAGLADSSSLFTVNSCTPNGRLRISL